MGGSRPLLRRAELSSTSKQPQSVQTQTRKGQKKKQAHRKPFTIYNFRKIKGQNRWIQRIGKKESSEKVSFIQSEEKLWYLNWNFKRKRKSPESQQTSHSIQTHQYSIITHLHLHISTRTGMTVQQLTTLTFKSVKDLFFPSGWRSTFEDCQGHKSHYNCWWEGIRPKKTALKLSVGQGM